MFDNYWYGLMALVAVTVVISFIKGMWQGYMEDDKDE
jgi:hypothetical protein